MRTRIASPVWRTFPIGLSLNPAAERSECMTSSIVTPSSFCQSTHCTKSSGCIVGTLVDRREMGIPTCWSFAAKASTNGPMPSRRCGFSSNQRCRVSRAVGS